MPRCPGLVLIALALLGVAGAALSPRRPPEPCTVRAARYAPPGLFDLVTYEVELRGPCEGVEVRVQFASSLGGLYPAAPITLNPANRTYIHPGNPAWWYPVKLTPRGPVRIEVQEVR